MEYKLTARNGVKTRLGTWVKVCGCSDISGIRMFFTAKSRPQSDQIHMMQSSAVHGSLSFNAAGDLSNKLEMRVGNTSRVML